MSALSTFTQWDAILTQAGAAQDVIVNLLLPMTSSLYSAGSAIFALCVILGLSYVLYEMLFSASGAPAARYFVALIVLTFMLSPKHTYVGDRYLYHASTATTGSTSSSSAPPGTQTYTVPLGFYALTAVTNKFEDYLYAVIDGATASIQASNTYNGVPLDAYSVLNWNYARDLNDPELASLYLTYQRGCRYAMLDNKTSAAYNVTPDQWYGVGFMSSGVLGTIGTDASTWHKIGVWGRADIDSIENAIDVYGWHTVNRITAAPHPLDITEAALDLSHQDPMMGRLVANNPLFNIKIKGASYWTAVFTDQPIPAFPYTTVPINYWYTVNDPSRGGAMQGIPDSQTFTDAAGNKGTSYNATDCLQLMNLVNVAFRYMRTGLEAKYNVPTGCLNGGTCKGQVDQANMANSSVAEGLALDAFVNDVANSGSTDPKSSTNPMYAYNGELQNGEGRAALAMTTDWKNSMSQLGLWMNEHFQVPLVCSTAIGSLALSVGLMMLLSPLLFAFAILPGRLPMLGTYVKILVYLKLTVWMMYVIFVVGGFVMDVLLQGVLNGSIGNMSGISTYASVAYSAESLVVAGVVFGAPRIVYMFVFDNTASLDQGIGSRSVSDMAATGEAVASAAAAAAAAVATMGGSTTVGGALGLASEGITGVSEAS